VNNYQGTLISNWTKLRYFRTN